MEGQTDGEMCICMYYILYMHGGMDGEIDGERDEGMDG